MSGFERRWRPWAWLGLGVWLWGLSGCQSQPLSLSPPPLLDPSLASAPALTLAPSAEAVENLVAGREGVVLRFGGLINEYRRLHGRSLLRWDQRLYRAALQGALGWATRAECVAAARAGQDAGQPACGGNADLSQRVRAQGYAFRTVLEDVYLSGKAALELGKVIERWGQSRPHRQALDNPDVRDVGVAIVRGGKALIYALVLGEEQPPQR